MPEDVSNMKSVINEELEAIIQALETQTVNATNRLRTCTSFEFPYALNTDDIHVHQNWQFSKEVISYAKKNLAKAFREQKSLGDISCYVIDRLEEKNDGSWLCLIKPAQIQVGMSFHSTAQLVLTFEADGIQYEVQINMTGQ